MTSLTALVVRVDGPWADDGAELIDNPTEQDHVDLLIEPATVGLTDAERLAIDAQQIRVAGEYVAGVLGRILAAAQPWIEVEREKHGCTPALYWTQDAPRLRHRCCAASGELLDLDACEWMPTLYLSVPFPRRAAWLARIESWLTRVALSG